MSRVFRILPGRGQRIKRVSGSIGGEPGSTNPLHKWGGMALDELVRRLAQAEKAADAQIDEFLGFRGAHHLGRLRP